MSWSHAAVTMLCLSLGAAGHSQDVQSVDVTITSIITINTTLQIPATETPSVPACLKCDYPPELNIVPETYGVRLLPGHSLEDHLVAIHYNLTPFIEHVFEPPPDPVVYLATGANDELLATIRSDPHIGYVACEVFDSVTDPEIEITETMPEY
jgi:hypothetical protein